VIVGKGQGLIVLLSGPPGTGKTLTAEAVADHTHRPLFHLQAEDLGINAESLGENLKKVFAMATDWDAVILLDEADVFMTSRNPGDIIRNELVSIFLRELEYFRGIIFLTTNLYETIDTAFRSRVSLHLLFPTLSREARVKVWTRFLDRIPESERAKALRVDEEPAEESNEVKETFVDEKDVQELSLWDLNGREIFNAVRMARSWCNHKGYLMTLERMESGIKVTNPQAGKIGSEDDYGDLYE
jgi:SpoVK/Ycf46/Vps4 family AAA+-type ATPase